jgi:hypothetical protein
MAGDIHGVTHLSSLSLHNTLQVGSASLTTASGLSTGGRGVTLSGGVLSLGTHGFSITTCSQMSQIADGGLGLVFQASGMSLCFRSGSTIYTVGASAVSAVRV